MPTYTVTLDDGRDVDVKADTYAEAKQRQQQLNQNLSEGEQWRQQAMAPQPVSGPEAFMLGAGRETDKLLSGAQDLYYGITGDDEARGQLAERQAARDVAFEDVQEQAPIASALGGVLPYLAVPTAGLASTVGVSGALGATRYGDDRLERGATDAALSSLPFAAGRAAKALKPWLFDVGDAAPMVARADDLGYPLSPGDRTGSKALKTLESGIDATPMLGNPMHRMYHQRQRLINRAAAEAIGETGEELTDEVLGGAAARISDEFDALEFVDDIPVGEEFGTRMRDIQGAARTRLFRDNTLEGVVDQVLDTVDDSGRLSATDYQNMSSQLKAKIRQSYRGESPDPLFAESLEEIVELLDDVAQKGVDADSLQRLKKARNQWRALKAVEKGARESGDVSGPLMANYLRRTDKGGYLRGRNQSDLYEAARMSKAFPARPDSGTAGRLSVSPQGLVGLALSPVSTVASNAYFYGGPALARGARAMQDRAPAYWGSSALGRVLAGYEDEEDEDLRGALSF